MKLEMQRTFHAPRDRVFAAWTQREQLEQWMCRDVPTQHATYTSLDVRPGGRYVIEIPFEGGFYRGTGTFREVAPPERLVFTWAWERHPAKPTEYIQALDCVITVQLIEKGEATEMLFTQEQLENQVSFDQHRRGWEGCFNVLEQALISQPVA